MLEFTHFPIPKFIPPDRWKVFELETIILANCLQGAYWYVADFLKPSNFTNWGFHYDYATIYSSIVATSGGDLIDVVVWLENEKGYTYPGLLSRLANHIWCFGKTQEFALKLIELQLEPLLLKLLTNILVATTASNAVRGASLDLIKGIDSGENDVVNAIFHLPEYFISIGAHASILTEAEKLKAQLDKRVSQIKQHSATTKIINDFHNFICNTPDLPWPQSREAKEHVDAIKEIFKQSYKLHFGEKGVAANV